MSYVKTQWVNNTTPINDTNLNKMEQGIYNNSLITEAIADKLNPTDTETYKTAELTEGQITDVIGVNDIVIKGQTSQNGEPTPATPQDIEVVTGNNKIIVSGKNLLPPDNNTSTTINGVTFTRNSDGSVLVNGTATANTHYITSKNFMLEDGKTYILSGCPNGGSTSTYMLNINQYYNKTSHILNNTGYDKEFTYALDSKNSNSIYIFIVSGTKCDNLLFKPMVSINGGDYEPVRRQDFPISLGSLELCKIGDYQDYFYKSGSKWYLHKETVKIIIPSLVNGVMQNNKKRFLINNIDLGNYDVLRIPSATQTYGLYCSILKEVTGVNTWGGMQGISYDYNVSVVNPVAFDFVINGLTTVEEYQEALAGKIIVARLNTATNTEITNTTLISQLEAIYNAPLYEQTNITQENNDLPMVLDITACKDNINGIKAFIRK